MAVYVCSDIHGMYDSYMKLLEKIDLKVEDKLYVLGDVIDRGTDGLRIIEDIMQRDNVELFIGNHELFLMDTYRWGTVNDDSAVIWISPNNGGYDTFIKFGNLSIEERNRILEFLDSCLVIKVIDINGKKFHLSHSSTLSVLDSDELRFKDMEYIDVENVVWNHVLRSGSTMDYYDNYKKDWIYISGHVRVQKLGKGKCTWLKNILDIDCGCAYGYENSSLCCVRLDDMEEFYIR